MSEKEELFLAEYDKRYYRMRNFLLTFAGVVFSTFTVISAVQIASNASVKKQVEVNSILLENAVSQKAIDNLIMTFENQTKVMEEFLPDDIKGAIKEFNRVSSSQRAYIIMYNSELSNRGGKE